MASQSWVQDAGGSSRFNVDDLVRSRNATNSVFAPHSAPFFPGLTLWLSPNTGVLYDGANLVTSVNDESENNYDAISVGGGEPLRVVDAFSASYNALRFDGVAYLPIAGPNRKDPLTGTTQLGVVCPSGYTVFAVIKTSFAGTTSTNPSISPPNPIVTNTQSWVYNSFGLNAGQIAYHHFDDNAGSWRSLLGGAGLNDGNAHTVAVTHVPNGDIVLYADGVEVARRSGSSYQTAYWGFDSVAIGYGTIERFVGDLGHTFVYDRALTSTQISALQTAYAPATVSNVTGTLAVTLGAATASSTATARVVGSATKTLDTVTTSSTATARVVGSATKTLDTATVTSAGVARAQGSAGVTLGSATGSAAGTARVAGAAAVTLDASTATGTGTVRVVGTAAPTLASATSSAAGTARVVGSATTALGDVSSSSTGTVRVVGTSAATLADATAASTATARAAGVATQSLDAASGSATGAVRVVGSTSTTLDGSTLDSAGSVGAGVFGELSAALADASSSATGVVVAAGALASNLDDASGSATGIALVTAWVEVALDGVAASSSGTVQDVVSVGTLTATLGDATLSSRIGQAASTEEEAYSDKSEVLALYADASDVFTIREETSDVVTTATDDSAVAIARAATSVVVSTYEDAA